jgi:hypothetical protein
MQILSIARKPIALTDILRHSRLTSERVTFMRLVAIYKLSATTDTNIILFTFFLTIFINMS